MGFAGGVHYFLISALKHRLWVLVRTDTSLRRFERVPIGQNMRNSIEYFTDVNSLTKFDKVISYSAEYITCEKSDRISHTYIRR